MYKRYYLMLFDQNKKSAGHIKMELTQKKLTIAIYSKNLNTLDNKEYYLYGSQKGEKWKYISNINNLKFLELCNETLSKIGVSPEKMYSVYILDANQKVVLYGNLDNDSSINSFAENKIIAPQDAQEEVDECSEIADEKIDFQSRILSTELVEPITDQKCPFECDDLGFDWQEVESYEFPLYDIVQTLIKTSDILNFVWHYGYYLLGINKNDKNIIAIGVPSYHGFDPHPFPYLHDIGIWVPENECTSVYGDFGFWVIGIDLNINKYFSLM